jgi:hypothetical protein
MTKQKWPRIEILCSPKWPGLGPDSMLFDQATLGGSPACNHYVAHFSDSINLHDILRVFSKSHMPLVYLYACCVGSTAPRNSKNCLVISEFWASLRMPAKITVAYFGMLHPGFSLDGPIPLLCVCVAPGNSRVRSILVPRSVQSADRKGTLTSEFLNYKSLWLPVLNSLFHFLGPRWADESLSFGRTGKGRLLVANPSEDAYDSRDMLLFAVDTPTWQTPTKEDFARRLSANDRRYDFVLLAFYFHLSFSTIVPDKPLRIFVCLRRKNIKQWNVGYRSCLRWWFLLSKRGTSCKGL